MDNYLTMKAGQEYPINEVLGIAQESINTQTEIFAVTKGVGMFGQVRPNGMVLPIGLFKVLEQDDLIDYKKAFYLMMEYFDSIPDEEKPDVDAELKKLGL